MSGSELRGSRWILTRPRDRAGSWRDALTELGAEVMVEPAILLSALEPAAVISSLASLPPESLLIFTSATTVRHLIEMLAAEDRTLLQKMYWIAVGPQTAAAIRDAGFEVRIEGDGRGAEALTAQVIDSLPCRRALHFTSDIGLPIVKDRLVAAGFEVIRVEVSRTEEEKSLDPVRWSSEFPEATGIIFSSPSAVRAVCRRSGDCFKELQGIPAIAAGEATAQELRQWGWKQIEMAVRSTVEEMIQACIRVVAGDSNPQN
ncbi:MAG TPA: uroporphyrinogen-III synthase [Planctomycetes bacterium]|nr:uroporphyrinogen-III synthase [Planctomycetota bacterium]HIK81382.1 uroporphyrinogen-III synthase [Planctomycetota bacterium]